MIDETGSLPERMRLDGKFALLRRGHGDVYFDRDQRRRRGGGSMQLALYWTPFRTGNGLAAMGTSSREFIGDSVDEIFFGNRFAHNLGVSDWHDVGVFRWMRHRLGFLDVFASINPGERRYEIAGGCVLGDLLKSWPAEAVPRLAKCASLAEAEIVMGAYGG